MGKTVFRIHPAIGIARVGNSNEYYLGPESMAGMNVGEGNTPSGGLPLAKDGSRTIASSELRDRSGRLKRQAARFKIYRYDSAEDQMGSEVTFDASESQPQYLMVDGQKKQIKDIVWSVHLANKKANCWEEDPKGIGAYEGGQFPTLRNEEFANEPDYAAEIRLKKLVIDAGPLCVSASVDESAEFLNNSDNNKYINPNNGQATRIEYPQLFPNYPTGKLPAHEHITTLGSLQTDPHGRLIVLGGYGKASGFDNNGNYNPDTVLDQSVNNNNWFDDIGDGPVTAVIQFTDGSFAHVDGAGWVIVSDPSYAPQIRNVVTLWDEMYNTWLQAFNLDQNVYSGGAFNTEYKPCFKTDIQPILAAADLQRWATNLKSSGADAHAAVFENSSETKMSRPDLVSFIRNPEQSADKQNEDEFNGTRMPLSLGDAGHDFLNLTRAQYFFVQQWSQGKVDDTPAVLGEGFQLDQNVLGNCLGGRFSPGIEMTFIIRDPNLYKAVDDPANAVKSAAGPFRVNMDMIDYGNLPSNEPVLGVGYIPLRTNKVQPGDLSKFMSIPWHTDYNSCATHQTSPNLKGSNMTYWSWPAQRPVAVYAYEDVGVNTGAPSLREQRFSVRGEGTQVDGSELNAMADVGRYQTIKDFLTEWPKVGFIIQGSAIDKTGDSTGKAKIADWYLEVESEFDGDHSNVVEPAPIASTAITTPVDESD